MSQNDNMSRCGIPREWNPIIGGSLPILGEKQFVSAFVPELFVLLKDFPDNRTHEHFVLGI